MEVFAADEVSCLFLVPLIDILNLDLVECQSPHNSFLVVYLRPDLRCSLMFPQDRNYSRLLECLEAGGWVDLLNCESIVSLS